MNFDLFVPFLLENWIFLAVVVILWYVGQEIKKQAPAATESTLWRFYWKTLPFHPVIIGIVLGAFAPVPASIVAVLGNTVGYYYYACAGVISIVWHDVYTSWKKHPKPTEE